MRLTLPAVPVSTPMIGSIEFAKGSSRLAAYLDQQHRWHCTDPEIEEVLEEVCPADPEDHNNPFAARYLLYTAAQRLGGHVSFPG